MVMEELREKLIRESFRQLIDAADKAAAEARQNHVDAMAMVPDWTDDDDAKFVVEERVRTAAETFARDRILDALTIAEQIALDISTEYPAGATLGGADER